MAEVRAPLALRTRPAAEVRRRHAGRRARPAGAVRLVSAAIYASVFLFFLLEMLLKPISGEDAEQQWCMGAGWASWRACSEWVLGFLPRIGQVFHYLTIWAFGSLPQAGMETLLRVSSALLLTVTVLIVVGLGLGRRPALRVVDASLTALVLLLLVTSPVGQVVLNGFSNVHNYVPVMAAALVAVLGLVAYEQMRALVGRAPAWVLTFGAFAVTTAGFDVNVLVIPGTVAVAWLAERASLRTSTARRVSMPWAAVGTGWVAGALFFWGLGDGVGSIQARMAQNHRESVDVGEGLRGVVEAVWPMVGNTIANVAEYAPLLLIALAAVLLTWRSPAFTSLQRRAVLVSSAFGVLTLLGLAPITDVMNRVSALAFIMLLVPVCALLGHVAGLWRPRGRAVLGLGLVVAVVSGLAVVDNTAFLVDRLERTGAAFELVREQGCIDRSVVAAAALPSESSLFRFHRQEDPFSYIFSAWYPPYFRLDGVRVPIESSCS